MLQPLAVLTAVIIRIGLFHNLKEFDMSQVIFAPNGIYKWFRNLVIGHTGTGNEADGFYIDKSVGTTPIGNLKYFKIGSGAPTIDDIPSNETGELTREFVDAEIKDNGVSGKGDIKTPHDIFPTAGDGFDNDKKKKELFEPNFFSYGNSPDSKVIGVLGATPDGATGNGFGKYWNVPGIAFQVGCHLTTGEANFDSVGGTVNSPDVVKYNEIGIFDDDDILQLYGIFPKQNKNETLTLKVNIVAMVKALDFQLVLTV